MNRDQWEFAKSVFQAAIQLPAVQRQGFIRSRCKNDDLSEELIKMVNGHADSTDFLESPLQRNGSDGEGQGGLPNTAPVESIVGESFHDFEIVRRIGSGGMGTVFEACQKHPHRTVAIKIVNPTVWTSEKNLRRFEHEAEILARLEHPGICQVFAAGWHDFDLGRQPWFAMELIPGKPLDPSHAKIQQATVAQKVQLILAICDAVEHAHSRGVIHRDLKPANILIVDNNSDGFESTLGQPKIVDFGVARVLDADRRETLKTASGDIFGTLNYMCPEQITANPEMIREQCDVYALGVIGYELLAGCLPYDRNGSSIAESLKMVEENQPMGLAEVNSSLRGDLQVIFAKALDKDPTRRYLSVSELASDLRRYQNHQPILARPASAVYRCKKFVSRHRTLVGGVMTTFLALILGIALYANEARQARRAAAESRYEAEKANAVNNFMTNDFMMKLLAAQNDQQDSGPPPAFKLVQRASGNIDEMFAGKPTIEAAIRNEIGTVFYNLNAFEEAKEQFGNARDLWISKLGVDHSDTLKAINNLGLTYRCLGQMEQAEEYLRRALHGRVLVLGEDDPLTLVTMNNLANLLQSTDRPDEAEALLRKTLARQKATLGVAHKETLTTMTNLGNLLRQSGDIENALKLHHEAWKESQRIVGEDHLMPLRMGNCYASTLYRAKDYGRAIEILTSNLDEFLRIASPDHRDVVVTRRLLARAYRANNQIEEAKAHLQSAMSALLASKNREDRTIRRLKRDLEKLED